MRYTLDEQQCRNFDVSSRREWLLPNGIGGYAMGTVAGINSRRYHGHLVAAITPPTGRMNLLAALETFVASEGNPVGLSTNQYTGAIYPEGYSYLRSFCIDDTAKWSFRAGGMDVEKEIVVHEDINAASIYFRNCGKGPFTLTLHPLVQHRDHHANFHEQPNYPQSIQFTQNCTIIEHDGVALHLLHPEADRTPVQGWYYRFEHVREAERGLDPRDDLFCPCELRYEMGPGEEIVLVASTGGEVQPKRLPARDEEERTLSGMLREAAQKFHISTAQRSSIIAGYPWFTDWGRDTMISLPGIYLHTGCVSEAKRLLEDYSGQMFQGLIPNRFVEKGEKPDYNTVDATLWYANAIYKTLEAEWDPKFARKMLDCLGDVYEWHEKGTLYGIRVDPSDGLLTQGEEGAQLTWMDAKVGNWVVTPRHGKPVEINGLWINALRCMESIANRLKKPASLIKKYREAAEKAEASFERKFWHEGRGHYLDTADPDDASLRPNQLIPMALPFQFVDPGHAARALSVISRELLTPMGVRTLGPEEPGYKGKYKGPLPELDAAYHQGTAWPWLLGSYATALCRYGDDKREAKKVLRGAKGMLIECGLGGISEVYDGDEPQTPGGCPWQAWSVAEILRAWVEDVGGE
ncbi:MAG TPA: amylo-alpha-1,6-glucosidase [Fimbriimonas sp.]|nr:amylo-alpha-1,6-glucosidase [Fimbriimonas sp.]